MVPTTTNTTQGVGITVVHTDGTNRLLAQQTTSNASTEEAHITTAVVWVAKRREQVQHPVEQQRRFLMRSEHGHRDENEGNQDTNEAINLAFRTFSQQTRGVCSRSVVYDFVSAFCDPVPEAHAESCQKTRKTTRQCASHLAARQASTHVEDTTQQPHAIPMKYFIVRLHFRGSSIM